MSIVESAGRVDPRLLKWGGYGLAALGATAVGWAAFAPGQTPALAAIVAPLASFAAPLASPALFEVKSRRSGRRGFNPLVVTPAVCLFILAVMADLTQFTGPLLAAALGAAAGASAGWIAGTRPGVAGPIQLTIALAVAGGLYGYGAFALANVRFDASPGRVLQVVVSGKHVSRGKSTSYLLELPPWGPRPSPSSVSVRRSLYDAAQPGEPVCIALHPGALQVPWYTVALCAPAGAA